MSFRTYTVFISALLAATSVLAQGHIGGMKGMDMGKKPVVEARQQTHTATGTVKKADAKAGKVTVEHGPIASLNWPAMTMAFRVGEQALWKKLEEGKKVELAFMQQGNDYVVTAVK